jgi:hypothetical protein
MFEVHYVREIFYLLAVLTTLKVVSGVLFHGPVGVDSMTEGSCTWMNGHDDATERRHEVPK